MFTILILIQKWCDDLNKAWGKVCNVVCVAEFNQAFVIFDTEGKGKASREQAAAIIRAIGLSPTCSEMNEILGERKSINSFLRCDLQCKRSFQTAVLVWLTVKHERLFVIFFCPSVCSSVCLSTILMWHNNSKGSWHIAFIFFLHICLVSWEEDATSYSTQLHQ